MRGIRTTVGLLCLVVAWTQAASLARAADDANVFVAPPRSVADVTAILGEYQPDRAKLAEATAEADRPAPTGDSDFDMARFYYLRGLAAQRVGRVSQQLSDHRLAYELGAKSGRDISPMLEALIRAETATGRYADAARHADERLRGESPHSGRRFGSFLFLESIAIARGNLDEAAAWVAQVHKLHEASAHWGEHSHDRFRVDVELTRPLYRAQVAYAEAMLAVAKGQFAEAATLRRQGLVGREKYIQARPRMIDEVHPPLTLILNARDGEISLLAQALREEGKLVEAEIEARRALVNTLKRSGRFSLEAAARLNTFTAILIDQGRFADAARMTGTAIEILKTVGATGSWDLAEARQHLTTALVADARWTEAAENGTTMMTELGDDPLSRERYGVGDLDWAIALVKVGRGKDALAMAGRLRERQRAVLGDQHYRTAEAGAVQAMAQAVTGDQAGALQAFAAAMPTLLAGTPQASEEAATIQAARRRVILEAYIGLLAHVRGTPVESAARLDAAAEAFQIAEAARGQGVQRALTAATARATLGDPALAELARREQDARQQVTALEGVLSNALAAPADQQDAAGVQALRQRIAEVRQAREAQLRELEQRFPDYAALINPKPATVAQARTVLRPGEALIATYTVEDATYVWAIGAADRVGFAAAPLGAGQLADAVTSLRRALDQQVDRLGDIPAFDVGLAYRLYEALLKPVETGWKGATSLLVVPDKALGQLPVGVLVTRPSTLGPDGGVPFTGYKSVAFLARERAVTQLPAVAALPALRALPAASAERRPFVGFADHAFNPRQVADAGPAPSSGGTQMRGGGRLRFRSVPATEKLTSAELAALPRLPDTADEVREIAHALKGDPDRDVLVGAAATERAVKSMVLSDRRVVMFATHGLVPGDLDGLSQPALALASPLLAGGEGDGLLTLDEVLGLKLNADWVVLSACNTASGDGAGAEAVSGLGRAFFYAGARALLVSNWPVETTSARALTTDLFRRQAENPALTRAEALRQAELALIDGPGFPDPAGGTPVFSYAHPIFWAPFSLIGDGGAATR